MGEVGGLGLERLEPASRLLTSWWSSELLVTPHPSGLYRGRALQVVSERSVDYALGRFAATVGSFHPKSKALGTGSWWATGDAKDGALRVCIPAALDEPDDSGRSRRDLPLQVAEHADALLSGGLTRFLVQPSHVLRLDGTLPVIAWPLQAEFSPVMLRAAPSGLELVRLGTDEASLGDPGAITELLTEMVAMLAYHYRPDVDGGSAVADVFLNDGDFLVRSQPDGSHDVRLQLVRRLEAGIVPEVLLLQLLQLHAFETTRLGGDDLGLPLLVSNPYIAFAGLARGRRYRAIDLGLSADAGVREAHDWIRRFAGSLGRSYRPWVERYFGGDRPPRFGDDLREGRTNLAPLRQRQHVLELGAHLLGHSEDALAARDYQAFIEARARERSMAMLPVDSCASSSIAAEAERDALAACLTFEEYMDRCLHDPVWGYYGHRVEIGRRGHFDTHPEALSPDYGAWMAERAHAAWRDLVAARELGESDRFVMVEFGAGNGRLACDVLDAVRRRSDEGIAVVRESWRAFAARLDYRIYELSAGLAERQRALLGQGAVVLSGDARQPEECLRRDFPHGLRGLVITNEVPDAFGVHKVLVRRDSPALATLVVPRLEAAVRARLPGWIELQLREGDRRMRSLGLQQREGEGLLDRDGFQELMVHLAEVPSVERDAVLAGLWFEEIWIAAAAIPALAEHLTENEAAYRRALGAHDAALLHVNVHAADFIRGLGAALAAGFVITIDYGGSTAELVSTAREGRIGLRTYAAQAPQHCPRTNDPYLAPGDQDVTTDVDFGDLARAGRSVGLEVLHYGPETDLAGSALPGILSAPGNHYAPLLGEAGFKVLVQGTRKSEFFGIDGASSLEVDD